MIHEEATLTLPAKSKAPGAKLYRQTWLPDDGAVKAVIILAHGYDEHSGRYEYFAQHCTDRGYAVYSLDHWGHGKSVGTNGFVPKFSVFHDGLDALIDQVPADHASLPLILIGHSMGGLISASYLLEKQSRFAAAVLSGPAIKASDEPSAFLKFVSGLLSKILPKMGVISLDANGVSRDPAVVADYLKDPLVSGSKISARLGHEMMSQMEHVQANSSQITLPIQLLHGAKDSLADAEGSRFLHDHVSSSQKQLKIYPELFHEIFNEPEKDVVLTDMTDWLDTVLAEDA